MSRRPIFDRPMPLRTARCSKRSLPSGERGTGRSGGTTRSTGSRDPVGSNSGSHTSSCCSKRTATSWPMRTSEGSHPTMFVVRCTRASSASATLATTYGGSKSGSQRWEFTVKPTTVPRPDTGAGLADRLRQYGQIGTGGCTSSPQSAHSWMRRTPSSPEVQNHSFAGVSSGSGLIPAPERCRARGRLRRGAPAGAGLSIDFDVVIEHCGHVRRSGRRADRLRRAGAPCRRVDTRCSHLVQPAHSNIDVNVERYARHRRRLALV